ncbi:YcxB-like protein [Paenibacillus uliginis N3/975]|uniref:YcxB-like protein n=1 Tax=Paenibacillus uliginis N3/975 TaxID=1313296 RepID=A0A1X7HT30_9BACL|nr:YcxB family protein [Paenibacillus uliginis]SMF92461.1 YcxB-like protein [Paenibacillus uliginis N3/975]
MKVVADLTKEDFWKFNKYVMFNLPKYKISMIISLLSIPISCIVISKLLGSSWVYAIVAGVIIGGLADVLFLYRIKGRTMKLVKAHDGILGEHLIEINGAGLFDSTARSQSKCFWDGIHELRQDKENIYIFVNNLQATIVPRRSFADQAEEAEFIQNVQQYANKQFI